MSRVYLMADFGKGPRKARSWQHPAHVPADEQGFAPAAARYAAGARAWWLVEADSAEAARHTIEIFNAYASGGLLGALPMRPHGMDIGAPGVVLASGGAA